MQMILGKGKSPVNSKKVVKAKRSKHTKKVSYTPQTSKEEQNLYIFANYHIESYKYHNKL